MFYADNAELLVGIEKKNITRSMVDYDKVQKQMTAQMKYETWE